jgi:hypothetical protein
VEILQLQALKSSLDGGSLPIHYFLHRLRYIIDSVGPLSFRISTFCTDRVKNTVSNSISIVACASVATGTCLSSRYLEMKVVSEPFVR